MKPVKNNISEELVFIFVKAREISKERKNDGIGTIHVLEALEKNDDAFKIAIKYNVILEEEYESYKNKIFNSFKIKENEKVTSELKALTINYGNNKVKFIEELLRSKNISNILEEVYADIDDIIKDYNKNAHFNGSEKTEEFRSLPTDETKTFVREVVLSKELPVIPEEIKDLFSDITEKARRNELAKVVGREEEVLRTFQILKRKSKSNPVIVGESGVGKSTIIESIAQKIIDGEVPEDLKNKHILELHLSSLMSGTKYQGDLEKKMSVMMNYIQSCAGSVIIFIDNIHNILVSQQGKLNLAEHLKPFLSNSNFACLGTSNIESYKMFEEDVSIARHFQTINIEQPTIPETITILRGLKKGFEDHHKIEIEDSAIIQAVKLSDRYITDRFFPDKAIDIIDEASSVVKIALESRPVEIQNIENRIKQKRLEKSSINFNDSDEEVVFQMNNLNKEIALLEKDLEEILKKEKNDLIQLEVMSEISEQIQLAELEMSKLETIEEQIEYEKENISYLKTNLKELKNKDLEIISKSVGTNDVLKVIAKKTGVPVDKMKETDRAKILNLENNLNSNLIGQKEAVSSVSRAIKRSIAGLSDHNRPNGSFLFLGSSGVGKTELCKQLAFELFGNKDAIIRLDMSEYMEKGTVSKLIGSPKGYKDSNEGGLLTDSVRKKPYSIVLFDEIEKADPEVWNLMLQMLDEGHLTDGRGRKINFKNTIIVMTSNIGAEFLKNNSAREKNKVMKELTKKMRPELINRIDEKIVFDVLDKNSLREIAGLMIQPTIDKMAEKRIKVTITDACLDLIVSKSYEPQYGARPLKRKMQSMVDDLLADYLLNGYVGKGSEIVLDNLYNNDRVQLVLVEEEE